MALAVTHPFVSAKSDGADTSLVRPTNWNATHSVAGTLDVANGGTGSSTAQGALTNIYSGPTATHIPANANKTFYVRTDGNDSNTGLTNTAGGAFLTVSRGIAEFSKYDWQSKYVGNLLIGDGTYTEAVDRIIVPAPYRAPFHNWFTVEGNIANPANCVIKTQADIFGVQGNWHGGIAFLGFTVFCGTGGTGIIAQTGSQVFADDIIFHNNTDVCIEVYAGGFFHYGWDNLVATIDSDTRCFILNRGRAEAFGTLNMVGNPTIQTGLYFGAEYGVFLDISQTVSGAFTGTGVRLQDFATWTSTSFPDPSSIPGGVSIIDTSNVNFSAGGIGAFFTHPFAGIPTSTDMHSGTWAVVKDTLGGGIYLVANDGGTIRKTQLL